MKMEIQTKLPEDLRSLFWSYRFEKLDINKNKRLIIIQVINYGTLKQWKWLAGTYGVEGLQNFITTIPTSEFRSGALQLASVIFRINQTNHAPRGTH